MSKSPRKNGGYTIENNLSYSTVIGLIRTKVDKLYWWRYVKSPNEERPNEESPTLKCTNLQNIRNEKIRNYKMSEGQKSESTKSPK